MSMVNVLNFRIIGLALSSVCPTGPARHPRSICLSPGPGTSNSILEFLSTRQGVLGSLFLRPLLKRSPRCLRQNQLCGRRLIRLLLLHTLRTPARFCRPACRVSRHLSACRVSLHSRSLSKAGPDGRPIRACTIRGLRSLPVATSVPARQPSGVTCVPLPVIFIGSVPDVLRSLRGAQCQASMRRDSESRVLGKVRVFARRCGSSGLPYLVCFRGRRRTLWGLLSPTLRSWEETGELSAFDSRLRTVEC
mmetsp:Transcript_36586/g.96403  ORF Transcript_36586/g.96403 Transcript_36586/m.96403 type:complete len:249 (-) Transcript_36586:2724-3470(-)